MKIIIIGGGAAGFFGSIVCAETASGNSVTILEKGHEVLSKVRISGGGRCNVTHACFDPTVLTRHYPRGERELRGPFTRFQPHDTIQWFENHGVELKTEPDGRMFPVTNRSQTILDCLQQAAANAGVQVRTQTSIIKLSRTQTGFSLNLSNGECLQADKLLLATGSNREGYRWAEALGHTIVPPVPSLFTFQINDPRLADLSGLSVSKARVSLDGMDAQLGPVLITHWGLSGPAILRLSAWAARTLNEKKYQADLTVNWLPELSKEEITEVFQNEKRIHAQLTVQAKSPFPVFARRLWIRFVESSGIVPTQRWAHLSLVDTQRLIDTLQNAHFAIQGKGVFKEEFVTCGGVKLGEVHFKTMESRKCPGLYFAGEILDIDGITGGFNFQNAWTTGFLAGQAMAANPTTTPATHE